MARAKLPASEGRAFLAGKGVWEGSDTTPISAAENLSVGFYLFLPKAPRDLGRGLGVDLRSEDGGLKPK